MLTSGTPRGLDPGQYIRDGKLYGWTGRGCAVCNGMGRSRLGDRCVACTGTGEEYGEIFPSDGAIYAAHSRAQLTPVQNAAIDAALDRLVASSRDAYNSGKPSSYAWSRLDAAADAAFEDKHPSLALVLLGVGVGVILSLAVAFGLLWYHQ